MSVQPKTPRWRTWSWQSWVVATIAVTFVAWFFAWGPVGLMELPANPKFCLSCHNMQLEYDAWQTSVHSSQICGDCHLPEEFFSRTAWDAYFGMRDFYKFSIIGKWDQPIHASAPTKQFLQDNCIRCHGFTAHAAVSEDEYCWSCHRELFHRNQLWKVEQAQRRTDDPRN